MLTPSQDARNKLGALIRRGYTDHDAEVTQARMDLRESLVMDAIRRQVDAAPPFPPERRLRIAAILCNPAGADG
jgi:hypothetical protein